MIAAHLVTMSLPASLHRASSSWVKTINCSHCLEHNPSFAITNSMYHETLLVSGTRPGNSSRTRHNQQTKNGTLEFRPIPVRSTTAQRIKVPGTRWILQMGNWTKANNSPKIKQPSDCRRNATLLEESPPNAKLDARLHIVYRRTMTTVQAADTSVVVQIHVRKAIVCNARQKKWTQASGGVMACM